MLIGLALQIRGEFPGIAQRLRIAGDNSPTRQPSVVGVKREAAARRPPPMKRTNRKNARKDRPTLPELDQTKRTVLNSPTSLQSRRSYQHAMDDIEWYCSEPRLALNRAVVLRYRLQRETKKLAASTINVRLAAVPRLAYGAADTGL
jgi:hypothetical protein